MNVSLVDQVVKAVLYEGYLLYPYRPSALKNRRRFNFGVVYPEQWSRQSGEPWQYQTEILVTGKAPRLDLMVRFLHLAARGAGEQEWQDAVEREAVIHDFDPRVGLRSLVFDVPASVPGRKQEAVSGQFETSAELLRPGLWKLTVRISNTTLFSKSDGTAALLRAMASTHVVLTIREGAFVSLLDPDEPFLDAAKGCVNVGLWPVLVGENGAHDTMLCSPIILYDYPQVAPESAGDLFDSTEIDEILSLRIMTLTDEEKREMREGDERARQILERTESLPPEHWMKLHGALRSVEPAPGGPK